MNYPIRMIYLVIFPWGFQITYMFGHYLTNMSVILDHAGRSIYKIRVDNLGGQLLQNVVCEGLGQDLAGCCEHFVQFETHLSEENENREFNGKNITVQKIAFYCQKKR